MGVHTLKITRVHQTELTQNVDAAEPAMCEWMQLDDDATDGDQVAEFMGRLCYQSWSKPNPNTATNEGYVAHVLDVGHHTLFGHAVVGYYIEGVSRSLTHELVRHRFPTFSQLSQRYVKLDDDLPYVVPPLCRGDDKAEQLLASAASEAHAAYGRLLAHLKAKHPALRVKQIREAARAVLPGMTETKIGVSANLRAWRDMLSLRLPPTADAEIRELAEMLLADLRDYAPHAFADIEV